MRLFDSKWIVEKRFSSFLADVPPGYLFFLSFSLFSLRILGHVFQAYMNASIQLTESCSLLFENLLCIYLFSSTRSPYLYLTPISRFSLKCFHSLTRDTARAVNKLFSFLFSTPTRILESTRTDFDRQSQLRQM